MERAIGLTSFALDKIACRLPRFQVYEKEIVDTKSVLLEEKSIHVL